MTRRANRGPAVMPWKLILLAGFCGGLAEVLCVALYSSLTTLSAGHVARQVTATLYPAAASLSSAPALGVAIHLVLSIILGLIFASVVWIPVTRRLHPAVTMISAVAVLGVIWALNFLFLLPALNPAFVTLMPYPATFVSKALFGVAMAWVLQNFGVQAKPVY